jgi:hypothetical protein
MYGYKHMVCAPFALAQSGAMKHVLTFGIENTTAFEALEKGLDDLMDLCDVVAEKFAEARQEFMNEEAAAA